MSFINSPRRRASRACARCRKRKTKCDFKFPTCTPCLKNGADCQGFDAQAGNDVPRSLVKSLEEQIAVLEARLKRTSNGAEKHNDLASKIAEATVSAGMPVPDSFFGNMKLSNSILAPSVPPLIILRTMHLHSDSAFQHLNQQRMTQHEGFQSFINSPRPPIGLRNIPERVMSRLAQHYTSTLLHYYPIVEKVWLDSIFHRVSQTQTELHLTHFESFVAYIVLAISSVTLCWKTNPQARAASLSLFLSALQHLRQIVEVQGLDRLQAVLLLAHYAHVNPELADTWTCISTAVTIVLDLGLHATSDGKDRELRQRLFWVTYNMDRALSAMLRLPLSFPEESISLKPDNRILVDSQAQNLSEPDHMTLYRSIEIEVHRVLHLKEDTARLRQIGLATSISDMAVWITDINSSLEEWYMVAQNAVPKEVLLFRHVMYNYLKAKIYRPTPRLPLRSPLDGQICFDVCQNIIDSVTDMFESASVIQPWQTLHIIFGAAVILLDACWQYRSQVSMRPAASHVVFVVIPKSLELIDEVGKWWSRAKLCSTCLQPMLEEVARPYSSPYPEVPGSSASDEATTKRLRDLMFADRIPYDLPSEKVISTLESQVFDDLIYNSDLEDLQWGIY